MRKTACGLLLLALFAGCKSTEQPGQGGYPGHYGPQGPPTVPNVTGPYGTPVTMAAPYKYAPPSYRQANAMMGTSIPLNMVQMHNPSAGSSLKPSGYSSMPGARSRIQQASHTMRPTGSPMPVHLPPGLLSPPGMPAAPGMRPGSPAAAFGAQPGGSIIQAAHNTPAGAVAGVGMIYGGSNVRFPTRRTQVRFVRPSGMKIYWYTRTADGKDSFSLTPINTPGRYNFLQAAVYRLKLTNITGHPGLEIYPTLEVVPANAHTEAFLAHAPVPLGFTPEDFKQVASGNYVVKVIYLPNPTYQDLAVVGPGEVNSVQLEPGVDPIQEAKRRGSILLVIRMGGIDQEAPNTPRLDSPGPRAAPPVMPHATIPPARMVPFGIKPPYFAPPAANAGRPAGPAGPNAAGQPTSRPGTATVPGPSQYRPPFGPGIGSRPQKPSSTAPYPPLPFGNPGGANVPNAQPTGTPMSRAPANGYLQLTSAQMPVPNRAGPPNRQPPASRYGPYQYSLPAQAGRGVPLFNTGYAPTGACST